MSLLPALFNDLLHGYGRPSPYRSTLDDIYDQHFGLGLCDHPNGTAISIPALRVGYLRPSRLHGHAESGVSSFKSDDKEFCVRLDVNHFKPEELKVTLDDKGFIVVEGNHEERSDEHGFISRQFTRRYKLPDDVIKDTLASNLSTDGVLTLQAAKKPKETKTGREIKIVKTNQPALKNDGDQKPAEPAKDDAAKK